MEGAWRRPFILALICCFKHSNINNFLTPIECHLDTRWWRPWCKWAFVYGQSQMWSTTCARNLRMLWTFLLRFMPSMPYPQSMTCHFIFLTNDIVRNSSCESHWITHNNMSIVNWKFDCKPLKINLFSCRWCCT